MKVTSCEPWYVCVPEVRATCPPELDQESVAAGKPPLLNMVPSTAKSVLR